MPENLYKARSLPSICLLSLAVGVIAGLGAWAFRMLIGLFHNLLFLGRFQFHYDANIHTPGNPWGPGIILVPVIGALVVAWLVKTFAPEAKGHGVPEVMDAVYYNDSKIRPVVGLVKAVASAVCIGSGGSVGREGPIIQIGASFGSTLGQVLKIPPRQIVTLIAAGAGGGIAATFNAPLGGLAFAMELLLVSINAANILPVAIGTATATYIGRILLGVQPSFYFPPLTHLHLHLMSPWSLLLFVPFGIVMGFVSAGFVKGIYWAEDRFDAMPGNTYTRHLSAMFVVGLMIWLMMRYTGCYYVQGVGYATIMDILKDILLNPWLLLLLFALKFVATCLTLGSGGSGGVFSPSLFMGATMGALFGQLSGHLFPSLESYPVVFAIGGMAAGVGASTGAIITGVVMILEMTRDTNVLLPVMITSAFAYGIRKWLSPGSIYTLKLLRRGHVVPEGLQAALSESMTVHDIMVKNYQTVDPVAEIKASDVPILVKEDQLIIGVIPPHVSGSNAKSLAQETYIFTPENNPIHDLYREMKTTGSRFALVKGPAERGETQEIAGIVTEKEVALHTMREAVLK
jgi:CIC family chloride channel protein